MDLNEKLIKMRSFVFSVLYLKGFFNRKESTHTLILISLYIYRIFKISIRHTKKTYLKMLHKPLCTKIKIQRGGDPYIASNRRLISSERHDFGKA